MKKSKPLAAFNSPFELGVRMVYLLNSLQPAGADLQMLVLLDYAIVYSDDLGGPPSLHTPVPYRGSEYMSRRDLIAQPDQQESSASPVSGSRYELPV